MKKRFTIIYSVFASAFILFTLLFLGYNLNKEYKQGASRTSSIFANAVFNLTKELEKTSDNTKSFYNTVVTSVNDFQDFSFYELKENDNIVFSYPANLSKEQTKSNFTKNFSTVIETKNNKYLLTCNIYLLRPYSIYYYSKISFFMILSITMLTLILIIIPDKKSNKNVNKKNSDKKKEKPKDENKELNKDSGCEGSDKDSADDNGEEQAVNEESDKNIEDVDSNSPEKDDSDDCIILDDIAPEEDCFTESENADSGTEEADVQEDEKTDINDSATNIENEIDENIEELSEKGCTQYSSERLSALEPEGLFSPSTGVGWESYLLTRLDNEIERSVASEMDISLFVIKVTDLSRESELARSICDYIVTQFQFRDLIFEYKEDCIVAIKDSTPIEAALIFADRIHSDIMKILKDTSSKCYIGISTRTVRIISGERFLKEAEEALIKAEEDQDCPIIAFRADIDKYKKYLESQLEE